MTGVKRYSSPLREQQAAATRRAVIAAAGELFAARGYTATTVDDIAARAGVSKPTVFTAVGNKAAVLSAVRDVAMGGDDEPVAVTARPFAREIADAVDAAHAVDLLAAHITRVGARYAELNEVIRGAAGAGDPAARELWRTSEEQRLIGARHWVRTLAAKQPLRADESTTVDLMWLLMDPHAYHRLVHGRGWSDDRFRAWLAGALSDLLR